MPSLAGFFSRKNKNTERKNSATPPTSIYSNESSPTTEHITPDRSIPSSPNGRSNLYPSHGRAGQASDVYPSLATSSNRLRLPFTRKKTAATSSASVATTSLSHYDSPRPSYMGRDSTGASSDGETDIRRLRPPPSKSAIFAAYTDPHSALSTRSLPHARPPRIETSPLPPPVPPKKPGFFHWSKSTPSSPQTTLKKPKPTTDELITPPSDSSFNLKSFRHVMPPSPNTSDMSLALPVPRPRVNSTTSEASQRISVAAFREAQARRSTADSPVPPQRSPSPMSPPLSNGYAGEANRNRPGPRPQQLHPSTANQRSRQPQSVQKNRSSALAYTSGSDESSSEEEEDSDEPARSGLSRRKHTITKRNHSGISLAHEPSKARGTKSELGHGSKSEVGHGSSSYLSPHTRRDFVPAPRSQSSHILTSQFSGPSRRSEDGHSTGAVPRSQSSLGFSSDSRPRASVSTSAISPSAAAKRASILVAANSGTSSNRTNAPYIPPPTQPRGRAPPSSSSSTSDSEDDAPLATLLAPRRPGSAMSSRSNLNASRSNVNLASRSASHLPKPLVDINQLTHGKRPTNVNKDEGFTPGATLIGGGGLVSSPGPISPIDSPITTSKSPPTHFVSPPSSPKKSSALPQVIPTTMRSTSVLTNPLRRDKSPDQKRDVLTERLTRVIQVKAGSGSSSGSGSTTNSGSGSFPFLNKDSGAAETPPRVQTKSPPKTPPSKRFSGVPTSPSSPVDQDLASMLGGGVSLISRNGETETETEESDSEEDETDKDEAQSSKVVPIAPIPIKQRAPAPAFSVTSRPQPPKSNSGGGASSSSGTRQRSSTLIPSSPSAYSYDTNRSGSPVKQGADSSSKSKRELTSSMKPGQRQRSSTMLPQTPPTSATTSVFQMPSKPFAAGRRESPSSSTGDSSSGRAPFTPRDGSEIGSTAGGGTSRNGGLKKDGWSGGVSGLPGVNKSHVKRRSVSFEEDSRDTAPAAKEKETRMEGEERRRERRRSEARAAIELGNVINGRGPVVEDDDDDMPINQTLGGARMSVVNPMMAMGGGMPMQMGFGGAPAMSPGFMGGWPQQQNPQMLSPAQFMPQAPDPNFMVAHQQAMMYAKQAYQMAVAQQAMAAAGDEWERGSTVGGFGGGSVYGGGSPSVVGSTYGMGMGMQAPGNGWSTGSVIMPPSSRSMYGGGFGGARSEYGGGGGGGGGGQWNSSRSSYGESFGPADRFSKASTSQGRPTYGQQRDSGYFPPVPPIPQNTASPNGRPPRSRTISQPASPGRGVRKAPPPSSWKAGV